MAYRYVNGQVCNSTFTLTPNDAVSLESLPVSTDAPAYTELTDISTSENHF